MSPKSAAERSSFFNSANRSAAAALSVQRSRCSPMILPRSASSAAATSLSIAASRSGLFCRGTSGDGSAADANFLFDGCDRAGDAHRKRDGKSTPRLATPSVPSRKADSLGRDGDRPRLAEETPGQRRGIAHDELVLLVAHERGRRQGAESPQHRGETESPRGGPNTRTRRGRSPPRRS